MEDVPINFEEQLDELFSSMPDTMSMILSFCLAKKAIDIILEYNTDTLTE